MVGKELESIISTKVRGIVRKQVPPDGKENVIQLVVESVEADSGL